MCVYSVMSDSVTCQLLCPWNFPVKNTGVGCHFLLQGIFLTQGLNTHLFRPALAGSFFTTWEAWCAHLCTQIFLNLRISCDFFLYLCFIVYLAVSGLSCSTRELCCGMWVFVDALRASLVVAGGLRSLGAACRIFSL